MNHFDAIDPLRWTKGLRLFVAVLLLLLAGLFIRTCAQELPVPITEDVLAPVTCTDTQGYYHNITDPADDRSPQYPPTLRSPDGTVLLRLYMCSANEWIPMVRGDDFDDFKAEYWDTVLGAPMPEPNTQPVPLWIVLVVGVIGVGFIGVAFLSGALYTMGRP